jgi:hypothetical protein
MYREVTYVFVGVRLLYRCFPFFLSFFSSFLFVSSLSSFLLEFCYLKRFLSDVFTGISGRIALSLISQWFPVPNPPNVGIFLTLTLVGWTDEQLSGRARLCKEHLFSRPDFLLGKWSYSQHRKNVTVGTGNWAAFWKCCTNIGGWGLSFSRNAQC